MLAGRAILVFFVAPLAGLLQRAPWGELWSDAHRSGDSDGPAPLVGVLARRDGDLGARGRADRVGARPHRVPRAVDRARARAPADGARRPSSAASRSLVAFGRDGLVGQYLDRWFGVTLAFSTWGVILAETFVAMPFLVITVEAALRSLDTRYEDAGATLGASRWTVMRRVTLPAIAPSLAAGAALTWARALGEFGATITFAGNFQGT